MRTRRLVIALLLTAAGAWAQSAPQEQNLGFFGGLLTTPVARQVGDSLTVIVAETTQASQQASASHAHEADSTVGPGTGLLKFFPLLGFSGSSQSSAQAGATRQESLRTRVSVRVVEALPTGNLRVEGERVVSVNGEAQRLQIRGEVRLRDIRADNTVLSQEMVNAQISYDGGGPDQPGKRAGLITRLLNLFF